MQLESTASSAKHQGSSTDLRTDLMTPTSSTPATDMQLGPTASSIMDQGSSTETAPHPLTPTTSPPVTDMQLGSAASSAKNQDSPPETTPHPPTPPTSPPATSEGHPKPTTSQPSSSHHQFSPSSSPTPSTSFLSLPPETLLLIASFLPYPWLPLFRFTHRNVYTAIPLALTPPTLAELLATEASPLAINLNRLGCTECLRMLPPRFFRPSQRESRCGSGTRVFSNASNSIGNVNSGSASTSSASDASTLHPHHRRPSRQCYRCEAARLQLWTQVGVEELEKVTALRVEGVEDGVEKGVEKEHGVRNRVEGAQGEREEELLRSRPLVKQLKLCADCKAPLLEQSGEAGVEGLCGECGEVEERWRGRANSKLEDLKIVFEPEIGEGGGGEGRKEWESDV
ncbi:hypothetical protein MMC13_004221 [Lambiella insularis]|nr:hypothetical protein [Lambiella insularis]